MNQEHPLHKKDLILPNSFYDRIIQDISVETWIQLIQEEPNLKRILFEGFSARSHRLPHLLRQPQIHLRLRRLLQTEPGILDLILNIWTEEQLPVVAFLEMLDHQFVMDHWEDLKNLLGPERYLAGLHLLGFLEEEETRERIGDEFWQRHPDMEAVELLVPARDLLKSFVREFPEAQNWLEDSFPSPEKETTASDGVDTQGLRQKYRREEEKRQKLEKKLGKTREETEHLREEIHRYRKENEAYRRQVAEWENEFDQRLKEALARERYRRFQRYHEVGLRDDSFLEKDQERLDTLIERAERAFELQRQADEEFGLVSTIRRQLLRVELYLEEMERIYADSLVIHPEVSKAKEGLLKEKERILNLPGIGKVLQMEPPTPSQIDLRQKLRLIETSTENLPQVIQIQDIIHRMDRMGLIEDAPSLQREISQKKKQILETLYIRFQPDQESLTRHRSFRNLDDFLRSGEGRKHDVYVDGYNLLLKAQGEEATSPTTPLPTLREELIAAVCRKSRLFRKVYLVFDGIEDFRDLQGNVEIIYSDKTRGITADMVIIQSIKRRKDKQALITTADKEIIRSVEERIYAIIDPYHFFAFVFDMEIPVFVQE